MSLVVCAVNPNSIIMLGDTQLNDENDSSVNLTGIKVFPFGNNMLVGMTGKYSTDLSLYNEVCSKVEFRNNTFQQKVELIRKKITECNKDNNYVIAGFDNGIAKVLTIGKDTNCPNNVERIESETCIIRTLLPPDITQEFCQKYINSLSNIEYQIVKCIEESSTISKSVNNKIFGYKMTTKGLETIIKNIRYLDIDFRIR